MPEMESERAQRLLRQLVSKAKPDTWQPSMRVLGRRWGLNAQVIAQQLAILRDEGLVVTKPRRGWYVGTYRRAAAIKSSSSVAKAKR